MIAIAGPTAVGKTSIALELARVLRARGEDPVAVSADALQVYEGLGTLTGAATADEQAELEHRLVGFVPVDRTFSAGEFMPLAHQAIDGALAAGRTPIVVGGTGLYMRAALCDLSLRPPPEDGLRERWERELESRGPEALHEELRRREASVAATIAPTDRSRILRALELVEMGELQDGGEAAELWSETTRHPTLLAGVVMERAELNRRIDVRVDAIVAAGGALEARRAAAAGASRTARKALGFEELLAGDVEAMKRRTRQFAKRQLTWFRKMAGIELLDATGRGPADVAREIARRAGRG